MKTLYEISQEYLTNVAAIEGRIAELELQQRHIRSQEERRRMRKRINALYAMAGEGRQTAFLLEHYYEKPEEVASHYVTTHAAVKPKRTKFSQCGYGAPTPALAMHGRNLNAAPVSGLRAQFSGRHAAKGHR